MEGNIKIIKTTEWAYTIKVKKLSIKKIAKLEIF